MSFSKLSKEDLVSRMELLAAAATLVRRHLAEVGIEHAFLDDVGAHAACEIKTLRKQKEDMLDACRAAEDALDVGVPYSERMSARGKVRAAIARAEDDNG